MDDLINSLLSGIDDFIHCMIAGWAENSLKGMFTNINGQMSMIGDAVSATPENYSTWGSTVYSAIRLISDDVILPIGVLIITALMCYELINAVLEKNAMHDMGSDFIFRWLMRACLSVLLLSMTFDISMAIFELGAEIAQRATSHFISDIPLDDSQFQIRSQWSGGKVNTLINTDLTLAEFSLCGYHDDNGNNKPDLGEWECNTGEVLGIAIMALVCKFAILACYIMVQITLVGRMIEIFMYLSVAPIPFATLTNREWGTIGTNYIKALTALALQGFFIIICVGIYSAIVNSLGAATDLTAAMIEAVIACVALVAGIRGSKNFAMSILNAH